jgi:hypothetical protein
VKVLICLCLCSFLLAIFLGIFIHFALAIIFALIFIGIGFYLILGRPQQDDKQLIAAQILMALVVAAENHTKYIEKSVRLRPGHQARWLEVHFIQ